MTMAGGVLIEIPGRRAIQVTSVVCDFTGTLARDGKLLPGVANRLRRLARRVRVVVATADTFGTARRALAGLPVEVRMVRTGRDKARMLDSLGAAHVAAVGNGVNDLPMARKAGLGVAVIGPEGAAGALIRAADIVVTDVRDAFDLLLKPLRVKATLRV